MTRQWLRSCKITVEGGKSLTAQGSGQQSGGSSSGSRDVSQLRVTFEVTYRTMQAPTRADVTIYNLSDETSQAIFEEGKKVKIEVGYGGELQLIFDGQIQFRRSGRETPVDTYLNLVCKSGDWAYRYAHVAKTLAAGHTFKDQVKVATDAMKKYGIEEGHMAELDSRKFPRAITLFGSAKEVLRRVCLATDSSWTIHNGKIQLVKNSEGMPGDTIVLNSRTGMIGRPVQTLNGIEVRCLMNPKIGPGTKVKIDEKSIQRAKFDADFTNRSDPEKDTMIPPLSADGTYDVIAVKHTGDTHGQEWYTDSVAFNKQGTTPSFSQGFSGANLEYERLQAIPVTERDKAGTGSDSQ
jgi:hypothetical protein